jgi:hypothetical protein
MPLDAAGRHKVLDWLQHRCPGFRCPACGSADWGVGEVIDGLVQPGRNGRAAHPWPGPASVPLVCVGCNHCAYVALFSAEVVGLRPAPQCAPNGA